jgi:(R,R)-butanediol dehydrogenase / meso-butanediol dehydrogenase / diacetyl reductase
MRAVVLRGPRVVELVDIDPPALLPGSVLVAVERCGVADTDLESFEIGSVPAPAWFGHEWSGSVVEIGDGVAGHFVGERVVGAVPPPCGSCRTCRAGFGDHCELVVDMIVGADELASRHGAFAEWVRVDARRLRPIPESIDDADATLIEPAAVAARAIDRARLSLGGLVAVIGAGSIGLLSAELARLSGAGAVVVIDAHPERRELACDLGADAAFESYHDARPWLASKGHGLGADAVFDCSGRVTVDVSMSESTSLVRRGGTVVAVGVRSGPQELLSSGLIETEIDLRASLGYRHSDVERVIGLMADDRLRVGALRESRSIGLAEFAALLAVGGRAVRTPLVAPSLI